MGFEQELTPVPPPPSSWIRRVALVAAIVVPLLVIGVVVAWQPSPVPVASPSPPTATVSATATPGDPTATLPPIEVVGHALVDAEVRPVPGTDSEQLRVSPVGRLLPASQYLVAWTCSGPGTLRYVIGTEGTDSFVTSSTGQPCDGTIRRQSFPFGSPTAADVKVFASAASSWHLIVGAPLDGELASPGTLTVHLHDPLLTVEAYAECRWDETGRAGVDVGPVAILGETVRVGFDPAFPQELVSFARDDAASYSLLHGLGSAEVVELSEDRAAGRIDFTDLQPDAESAPPGPLPSPLEDWIRPLGGDPGGAKVSGYVSWTCDPPPPGVPSPLPTESPDPDATPVVDPDAVSPEVPQPRLVAGQAAVEGVPGCGATVRIEDVEVDPAFCGLTTYLVLGPEAAVTVTAGGRLEFRLPDGWTWGRWEVGWATQAAAERWRGLQPDTFDIVALDTIGGGTTITTPAPPPGEWSVRLDWSGDRGADVVRAMPSYFRVLVTEPGA